MWKQALLVCAFSALATANYERFCLEDKPPQFANMPGCYISELNIVLPVGQSIASEEQCMKYNCEKDALSTNTCFPVSDPVLTSVCKKVKGDPCKPYPDCCDKKVCKGSGKYETIS